MPLKGAEQVSEQVPNPGRPIEKYSVDELFNHEERQAREQREQEWAGYLEKRYSATQETSATENDEYESMSVSQLANKLGEAMGYGDRTTAGNVGDVLTRKVDEFVEQSRSTKDSEHNDLREQQIRDRIAGIAFRRAEEIKSQVGPSEGSTEGQDINQDHKEVLEEEQPTELLVEAEKTQEQEGSEPTDEEEQVARPKADRMTNIRGVASSNPLKLGAMAAGVGMPSNPNYRHSSDAILPGLPMTLKDLGYYADKEKKSKENKKGESDHRITRIARRFGSWAMKKTGLASAEGVSADTQEEQLPSVENETQSNDGNTTKMPVSTESSREDQARKPVMERINERLEKMEVDTRKLSAAERGAIVSAVMEHNGAGSWIELSKLDRVDMPDAATIRAILEKQEDAQS